LKNSEYAERLQNQYDNVRKIQRESLGDTPSLLEDAIRESNRRLGNSSIPDFESKMLEMQKDMDVVLRDDLYKMQDLIISVCGQNELADVFQDHIPIVFAATGDPNAAAFCAPDGNPIIKIEEGLYGWLSFMNRLLLRCTESGCDREKRKQDFINYSRHWTELFLWNRIQEGPV